LTGSALFSLPIHRYPEKISSQIYSEETASMPQAGSGLFGELKIRDVRLANRIVVSPMCQYSCENGLATDWHFVHLGCRAVGGAGLVIAEATAVLPEARISPQDLGIWSEAHIEPLSRITNFIHSQGCIAGIQIAHAGRKASTMAPWKGAGKLSEDEGGWSDVVAPSAIAFAPNYPIPIAAPAERIASIADAYGRAAQRALDAGFRILEIHAAHGYLLHEFFSPLSNHRADSYGGSFENRTRIAREVVTRVRRFWPERLPLFIRISSTDWVEGGWDIEQAVELARTLGPLGVDLVDCSSGGNVADAKVPMAPGYQVPFAERIRRDAGILTGAVGLITEAQQADEIIRKGQADIVLLAREMLRDPYWPLHAAAKLGKSISWPVQYLRAAPAGSPAREPREDFETAPTLAEAWRAKG
jgi:2,4-dienoyl-CoA reductase-like NADH-dependent reductase (Old Yellow Enzyme family)